MVIDELLLAVLLVFWLAGTLLLSAGIFSFLQWVQLKRRGTVTAGAVREGQVTTTGRAAPSDDHGTVTAPISGTDSLVYEYQIQHSEGSQNRQEWEPTHHGRDGVPFEVADDSGGVLVDPEGAKLTIEPDEMIELDASEEGIAAIADALATCEVNEDGETLDVGVADLEIGEQYKLLERRIEQGDTLDVTGPASQSARAADLDLIGSSAVIGVDSGRSTLQRFLGVPFTLSDGSEGKATTRLLNRTIVLVTFGTPLFLLPVMFLFPPTG